MLITAFFEGSSLLNGCYDLFLFFFDLLLNPPDSAVCRVEVLVELLVQGRVLAKKVIKLLCVINFAFIRQRGGRETKRNCHDIYKTTLNRYKEQGHPLSTEQNEILDALKQYWS